MRFRSLTPLIFALALGGCDAWPIVVNNRTEGAIRLQYHAHDFLQWSGTFPISAGNAQRLANGHWIQDMVGLKIEEGGKIYELSYDDLAPVRRGYPSNILARRFKFALDCYVDYLGRGRLRSSFAEPRNLRFEKVSD
jgi:hypothetical protein